MKFIDLFSGMGGFRLALSELGLECAFSADYDQHACETYEKNFGTFPLIDITQLEASKVPDHDVLCGGFPCQPFSIAGYRRGFDDTRGTLFFDVLRIIGEKKPKIFILENVKGLINHNSGNTFSTMLNLLAREVNNVKVQSTSIENLGYYVYWKVLNAKDFGIAQNRERVFIVGFKEQPSAFQFPESTLKRPSLAALLEDGTEARRLSAQSREYVQHFLRQHPCYSSIKDLDYLIAYEIRKSRTNFRFDDLSPCLTTKMGTGGNNVPYLVNQSRFLSLRECLKIQGFPANFKLTDSYNHALRQIGNSVAVPVVKAVAKNALTAYLS